MALSFLKALLCTPLFFSCNCLKTDLCVCDAVAGMYSTTEDRAGEGGGELLIKWRRQASRHWHTAALI